MQFRGPTQVSNSSPQYGDKSTKGVGVDNTANVLEKNISRKGKTPMIEDDGDVESDTLEDMNFEDSEDSDSGDDQMFDDSIDLDVEWVGNQNKNVRADNDTYQDGDLVNGKEDLLESADELDSVHDSESETEGAVVYKFDIVKPPVLLLGMMFSTKKEFRDAIDTHAIFEKRNISYPKSDKHRIYAICDDKECSFRINALKKPTESAFQITTCYTDHTCAPSYHVKNMRSRWLSQRYGYQWKSDTKKKVEHWRTDVITEVRCHVTPWQAYLCKQQSIKSHEGLADEQYSFLWDYAEEIKRTNPNSTVLLNVDPCNGGNRFKRFYVCLAALKKGLLASHRKIFGLDGTHLKGPHGGILLTAVGVDPNNNSFPFAYAVVNTENGENWDWFVRQLKEDLNIENDHKWTVISDKQKGLLKAVADVLPNASHRHCVRHMHANFRNAGFGGYSFKIAFWRAAKATTPNEFKKRMEELKKIDQKAYDWFNDKSPHQWSRAYFTPDSTCDILLNNMCESFNSMILRARELPILSMLEEIFKILMKRSQINRDKAKRWKGAICPRIKAKLIFNESKVADCIPIKSNERYYQITCLDKTQYSVDLLLGTCGCRKWDLTGIPCKHALSAIHSQRLNPENYVNACYQVKTYLEVYEPAVLPINGRDEWRHIEAIPPMPPKLRRTVGRPPKARKRDRYEPETKQRKRGRGRPTNKDANHKKRNQETVKCSKCGVAGHNKRSCKSDFQQVLVDCGLANITNESVLDEIFSDIPIENLQQVVNDVPASQELPDSQLTQLTQFQDGQIINVDTNVPETVRPSGSGVSRETIVKPSKLTCDGKGKNAIDGSGGSSTLPVPPTSPILDK